MSVSVADLTLEQQALLSFRLSRKAAAHGQFAPSIARRLDVETPPASFAQERLWLLHLIDPDSAAYNLSTMFDLRGPVRLPMLRLAVDEVIARHEVFRTRFEVVAGRLVQVIAPAESLPPTLVDLEALPAGWRRAVMRKVARKEARRRYDLKSGPLLRAVIIRLAELNHILLLCTHHIVSDAWSTQLFISELAALYNAFCDGRGSPLPPVPLQYGDFAVWERQWLQGPVLKRHILYWTEQLTGT